MRGDPPILSRILWNSLRRNIFLSAQPSARLSQLFAFGCCLWASVNLPLALCASVIAFAVFAVLSGNGVRRAPLLQGAFLRNAPFQIFETVVTLVALTMRLSPLERDFVAASLLNLLYRF
ncbi:hypothetical protein [Sphingopyxis sp.]|uniref:hypothetical protein n=1 Tax=Sphingopyxis sp. TaxID=1908224 RepID=UPI0026028970|nr:hypothetical protein [Sphingopyxis sp.]MCW0197131.1 hypothetical protein [Sphingopyxis sp.]